VTRTIVNRFTNAVIWSGEAETMRDAIHAALDERANLSGANLSEADLSRANLSEANLSDSLKSQFRDDLWAVLSASPAEVPGLLSAIKEGRIDGSHYEGACACLVGTLANVRQCAYDQIPNLAPNASRLSEVWFLQIKPGQTPDNHEPSRLAAEWVEDWLLRMRAAFSGATA